MTCRNEGRDHHPCGFTIWLAGGGVKGGTVYGATDELGFHAVEDRHYVTDLHATVLKQMGLDAGGVSRNPRKFRHSKSSPASSASRSIILPPLWNV